MSQKFNSSNWPPCHRRGCPNPGTIGIYRKHTRFSCYEHLSKRDRACVDRARAAYNPPDRNRS